MTFINDYQQLFAMLQVVQLVSVIAVLQTVVLQIGMEAHLIVETVFVKARACSFQVLCPVLLQLLWTKQEDGIALYLKELDDGQRRECLTKSDGICQDGTIVFT